MAPGPEVEVAVDNDVLLKAACYGLAIRFWPQAGEVPGVGILGASRFVLAKATERGDRVRDQAGARRALDEFFALTAVLEPSGDELRVAAELERLAQRAGLALDIGESQLAAMLAGRDIAWLDTGDKRAVAALDGLVGHPEAYAALSGRVRCLEQLFLRLLDEAPAEFGAIASSVCAEPDVDKTVTICFACLSGGAGSSDAVCEGLQSYVGSLRAAAPRVLAD